jgi:hypothetical protein
VLFIDIVLFFVAWPSSLYVRSQKLAVVPSKSRSHKVDEREQVERSQIVLHDFSMRSIRVELA